MYQAKLHEENLIKLQDQLNHKALSVSNLQLEAQLSQSQALCCLFIINLIIH